MRNPWLDLGNGKLILPCDKDAIDQFNSKLKPDDLRNIPGKAFPEPFAGSPEAPLVLLNGNPGANDKNLPLYQQGSALYVALQKNLLHQPSDYPFFLLNPKFSDYGGFSWWTGRLRPLIEIITGGAATLASRLLCVEYFPYHSRGSGHFPAVESQRYSFYLVENAIARGATIVIMRSESKWKQAVPGLGKYSDLVVLSNCQKPYVSREQCGDMGWESVCRAVTGDTM